MKDFLYQALYQPRGKGDLIPVLVLAEKGSDASALFPDGKIQTVAKSRLQFELDNPPNPVIVAS